MSTHENLRKLGLSHLEDKPEELSKELDRRLAIARRRLKEPEESPETTIPPKDEGRQNEIGSSSKPAPKHSKAWDLVRSMLQEGQLRPGPEGPAFELTEQTNSPPKGTEPSQSAQNPIKTALDPEIVELGTKITLLNLRKGVRTFRDFATGFKDHAGENWVGLKKMILGFWNIASENSEFKHLNLEEVSRTQADAIFAEIEGKPPSKEGPRLEETMRERLERAFDLAVSVLKSQIAKPISAHCSGCLQNSNRALQLAEVLEKMVSGKDVRQELRKLTEIDPEVVDECAKKERAQDLVKETLSTIANGVVRKCAKRVIIEFKGMERSSIFESDIFEDPWEDYVVQVHGRESYHLEEYEALLRKIILGKIRKLSPSVLKAIWFQTENGGDWLYDYGEPTEKCIPFGESEIVDFIYSLVWKKAADCSNRNVEEYLYPRREA